MNEIDSAPAHEFLFLNFIHANLLPNEILIRLISTLISVKTHSGFLKVLHVGTVSTNVFLRRIHNFALDMGWLPWPVVVKRQWPSIEFKEKRAITWEEHCRIIEREKNPERKAFYKMAWHLGASQSDLAFLEAENIDWEHHVISYARKKTGSIAIMRFAEDVAEIHFCQLFMPVLSESR